MPEETAAYTANGEPKYPFTGRIVEAYYTNNELSEIDIIHNYDVPDDGVHTDSQGNPNGGKEGTTIFSVSVNEEDERFLALLQEFSYESIDECTKNRNEGYREQFREAFQDYARRNKIEIVEEVIIKKEVEIEDGPLDLIFEFDSDNEVHKDILFRLKLKMFEQEVVQKSKKKKAKTDIRKSETLGQALKAYCEFL